MGFPSRWRIQRPVDGKARLVSMSYLFVAMESKHRKSSIGAACCVPVGHVFAHDKKTRATGTGALPSWGSAWCLRLAIKQTGRSCGAKSHNSPEMLQTGRPYGTEMACFPLTPTACAVGYGLHPDGVSLLCPVRGDTIVAHCASGGMMVVRMFSKPRRGDTNAEIFIIQAGGTDKQGLSMPPKFLCEGKCVEVFSGSTMFNPPWMC